MENGQLLVFRTAGIPAGAFDFAFRPLASGRRF
jgi:hypothetical protein